MAETITKDRAKELLTLMWIAYPSKSKEEDAECYEALMVALIAIDGDEDV